MEKKTFPVGSIVKIKETRAMVTGIRFVEIDGYMMKSYLVVSYPCGYIGEESCRVVRADEAELIWEAPCTEKSGAYLRYIETMEIVAQKVDAKTLRNHFSQISKKRLEGA